MGRRVRKLRFASGAPPASGADHVLFSAGLGATFDEPLVSRWNRWRRSHPVRATGGVVRTGLARPAPGLQQAWRHYVRRHRGRRNGKLAIEWWMPPFLVPAERVSDTLGGGTGDEALKRVWDGAATARRPTHQQYTDVRRITCLARELPMVSFIEPHRLEKSKDAKVTEWNAVGRATKCHHQSSYDLYLHLGSDAGMFVGCSVHGANEKLLSLWWRPAGGLGDFFTREQESLRRAVFFDVVEAAHYVPSLYAKDFAAASGASRPAAPPAAASDAGEAPPTCTRGSSNGATEAPFPGAAAPVASRATPSTAAPSTSSAAPPTSSAAPSTSSAAPSASAAPGRARQRRPRARQQRPRPRQQRPRRRQHRCRALQRRRPRVRQERPRPRQQRRLQRRRPRQQRSLQRQPLALLIRAPRLPLTPLARLANRKRRRRPPTLAPARKQNFLGSWAGRTARMAMSIGGGRRRSEQAKRRRGARRSLPPMRRPLPLAPSSRQPLGKRLRTPSPPLRKQRMRQTMRQRRAGQRRRARRRRRTGGGGGAREARPSGGPGGVPEATRDRAGWLTRRARRRN